MGRIIDRRRVMGGKKKPIFTATQNPYLINMMLDMGWISQPSLYEEDLENVPNFLIVKTTTDNRAIELARFPRSTGYSYRNEIYSKSITFEKAGFHLVLVNGPDNIEDYEFDGRGFRDNRICFYWFKGVAGRWSLRSNSKAICVLLGDSIYGGDSHRNYTIDKNVKEGWLPLSSLDESWQINDNIETW